MQVLGDLLRVRTLVRQQAAKHDESRTQEYLYAAARGDTNQIQQVCVGSHPFCCSLSGGHCETSMRYVRLDCFLSKSHVCAANAAKAADDVQTEPVVLACMFTST